MHYIFKTCVSTMLVFSCAAAAVAAPPPDMSKNDESTALVDIRFETADGVKIQGDFYPSMDRTATKPPLAILIHMYPADRKSWAPLIPNLREAGFSVLAYDIRGRGGSIEPPDKNLMQSYNAREPSHFRAAWRDVEAAKQWVARQMICNTEQLVLVGASIGCSIALDYAARDDDVKAVVCLSPGTDYMGVDSVSHIRRCANRPILLMSPATEYDRVEALVKASGDKAEGRKYTGDRLQHGTKMFDADYGDDVKRQIIVHLRAALSGAESQDAIASATQTTRIRLARESVGKSGPIYNALNVYHFMMGDYPDTLDQLLKKPANPEKAKRWQGPLLAGPDALKDPWGNPYRYRSGAAAVHNAPKYDLWSTGPDGQDGTDDDITNW